MPVIYIQFHRNPCSRLSGVMLKWSMGRRTDRQTDGQARQTWWFLYNSLNYVCRSIIMANYHLISYSGSVRMHYKGGSWSSLWCSLCHLLMRCWFTEDERVTRAGGSWSSLWCILCNLLMCCWIREIECANGWWRNCSTVWRSCILLLSKFHYIGKHTWWRRWKWW